MEWFFIIFIILIVIASLAYNIEQHSKEIRKVVIVSSDSRKKVGSVASRGIVGGALLGPVGLVAGAASGKNKNSTTFLIEYKDGSKETRTVANNSSEFERLCRFIEM